MSAAYVYFFFMVLLMTPLAIVHWRCRSVVGNFPKIMPDSTQRDRYRWGELAMAFTCVAMMWYMWLVLDFMVTFCATQPVLGFVTHAPWILGTLCVLAAKNGHLRRLQMQAELLVTGRVSQN